MTASARTALAVPGALPAAAWSLLGRFGFSMNNLSLLLYVAARTDSYAVAGTISAAGLIGTAAGIIAQSRLLDRYGTTRTLLTCTAPYALLSAAVLVAVDAGLATLPLAVLAAVQCAMLPTVQVASRAMWSHLVPAGPVRDAAYSYEAISFEMCWLLGPAVAAVLATWLWPGSALLISVTLSTVPAVGFALTAAARSHRGATAPSAATARSDEGLRAAGLAVLLVATCAFGLTIGFVVVGVTAGTRANGVPQLAGVLLGLWSITSVLSGVVYQRAPWPRALPVRLPALMAAFGLFLVLPAVVGGTPALTVGVVLAGATLVPQVTAHNTLLDGLVPPRRLSEAFGWITTAIFAANAGGQALGGFVIERYGYQAGFRTAAVCGAGLAAVVWAGRRHLLPGPVSESRRSGGPER
ncbi:MFS transporter [Actinoplanes sp. NPDC048791]|uniref:MFS transporter n=1 Tax=Actinoplanes sp. NPDC048791 TaxID=3154623 RepID=UPI0033FB5159